MKCFPKHLSLLAVQGTGVWKSQDFGNFPASQHPHHQYPKQTFPASLSTPHHTELSEKRCMETGTYSWNTAAPCSSGQLCFQPQSQPPSTWSSSRPLETDLKRVKQILTTTIFPSASNSNHRAVTQCINSLVSLLGTFGSTASIKTLFSLYWAGARPNRANKPSNKRNYEAKQREQKRTAESWIRLTEEMLPWNDDVFSVSACSSQTFLCYAHSLKGSLLVFLTLKFWV